MSGKPAARIGDMHICHQTNPATRQPHEGGPIIQGVESVETGNRKQATVTHKCICRNGPYDEIAEGADTVLINNLPAARLGDRTIHDGRIIEGDQTVLIGNSPAGGGSASSAGPGPDSLLSEALKEAVRLPGLPPPTVG